jgi:transcriptional regulator with XRE-family HTH domain
MATSEVARAFGREVRRRRHAQGMTLDVLAESSGVTPNYIGQIEGGLREPSIDVAVKLASGLGAPLGEVFGMPELPADTLEAARLLSALPGDVREPVVTALRALATWAGGRHACSGS